ncbi:hypothetical protein ACOJUR_13695 [Alicyclobacillus tolerans]|uniref:Membrane domain of glycerophosphoryl diester phosphodiesterase n=2 Tax=Alicyclobacillus tolerans TaxID=90970 RepID=A0A1M6W920_9BACL|nr:MULTISPECIES: hypothetical protein [Alicyclobacillus]MDP9729063.1 hypothetical protein [Alicyclobacillus tengchongensis]SHK90139.1 hypothetical protein SAMN05443507_12625 [Alicyclobacillus montanus]
MNGSRSLQKPLGFWAIYGEAWKIFRKYPGYLFGATIAILVPYSLLNIYVSARYANPKALQQMTQAFSQLQNTPEGQAASSPALSAAVHGYIWLLAVSLIYLVVAKPFVNGMLIFLVMYLTSKGEAPSLNDGSSYAVRRWFPYIGTVMMLAILVIGGSMAVSLLLGVPTAVVSLASGLHWVYLLLFILLFVIAIYFAVRFSLSLTATLAQPIAGLMAVGQSWGLTKRFFFRTLFFLLLIVLLNGIIPLLISFLGGGQMPIWLSSTLDSVVNILLTPFSVVAVTCYYVDLLVRHQLGA